MKLTIKFDRRDIWVGAFWDREKRTLYVCPLPMLVFIFRAEPGLPAEPGPLVDGGTLKEYIRGHPHHLLSRLIESAIEVPRLLKVRDTLVTPDMVYHAREIRDMARALGLVDAAPLNPSADLPPTAYSLKSPSPPRSEK